MKNKEIYIEKQFGLIHFNKLLITEEIDNILKELLNDYDILEIIDIIENYINREDYICFICLFDDLKNKLINFVELVIFAHKRYIKYKEDEEELMYEDTLTDLLNMLDYLVKLNNYDKEEYKDILLSYRKMNYDENSLFNLKISYILDEELFNYLNGKIDKLDMKSSNYIYSLLYYFHTVKLSLNKKIFVNRVNKILGNIASKEIDEYIKLLTNLNYTDIYDDDLCKDLYGKIELEGNDNNIVDISKYR